MNFKNYFEYKLKSAKLLLAELYLGGNYKIQPYYKQKDKLHLNSNQKN